MILILSSDADQSTLAVIKWLNYFKVNWIKLNSSIALNIDRVDITNQNENFCISTSDGKVVDTAIITGYWYRRNDLSISVNTNLDGIENEVLKRGIESHINKEIDFVKTGMHSILSHKNSISDLRYSEVNKLEVLSTAQRLGLSIPDTIITTKKSEFMSFKSTHGEVVSKAIQRGARFTVKLEDEHLEYLSYTEPFDASEVPTRFFPTLFQKKLQKKYELRAFYLRGTFYTMAIFSQNDSKTQTDFRHYNLDKPNRTVPYLLPKTLEQKLANLMDSLHLDSGSIDLVVTSDNEYVFLEVNPIGQFGMVSAPCNFYLHKILAEHLIHNYEIN